MRLPWSSLQLSTRRVHTAAGIGPVHRLTEPSSWVRPIAAGSLDVPATDATLRDDFLLWPGFFSLEESRQLLAMALWKLDRADSTRRRRRKGGTSSLGEGDGVRGGLQDMFYGEYGFEEVSRGAGSGNHVCLGVSSSYSTLTLTATPTPTLDVDSTPTLTAAPTPTLAVDSTPTLGVDSTVAPQHSSRIREQRN